MKVRIVKKPRSASATKVAIVWQHVTGGRLHESPNHQETEGRRSDQGRHRRHSMTKEGCMKVRIIKKPKAGAQTKVAIVGTN